KLVRRLAHTGSTFSGVGASDKPGAVHFQLLAERRERNASEAASQRDEIVRGHAAGWNGLSQSILIAGGFLVLMFFFLLVAIERHQRRSRSPVA
ncbi:hypothetical protein ACH0BU_14000, partial [Sphingomonas olei]